MLYTGLFLQKHSAMELLEQEEMGELKFQAESEPNEVPLPVFMKEEETISGASRGTLYHKVFEKLQIDQVNRLEDVTEELNRLVCCGFLTEEEKLIIKPDKIRGSNPRPKAWEAFALPTELHPLFAQQK